LPGISSLFLSVSHPTAAAACELSLLIEMKIVREDKFIYNETAKRGWKEAEAEEEGI
jgi:hypothetical protein